MSPRRALARLRRLLGREDVAPIARRYLVSNGFDGTLTCVGVVVGATLTGVTDGATVIRIGLGAAAGLGTSAVWSVWEIERAETAAEIDALERAMLTDLDDTQVERERRAVRLVHAGASGTGPLIGGTVPLVPFLFRDWLLGPVEATVLAVAIACLVLGAFGAYMGAVAGGRPLVAAARMAVAGLVVAGLGVLLPG